MSPETEMIQSINIQLKEDSVVCAKQIDNNVFISNTIIPKHGTKHIRILNPSDDEVSISKLDSQIKPLSNYNILHEEKNHPRKQRNNNQRARWEKFLNLLNIDKIDVIAIETIKNFVENFNIFFILKGIV